MVLSKFSLDEELPTSVEGDISDVIIASRIRLARNIADFPFVETCSEKQVEDIETRIRTGLSNDQKLSDLKLLGNDSLDQLERQFLLELDSITGAKSDSTDETVIESDESKGASGESIDALEQSQLSLTLNDEDHLRLQIIAGGYDLIGAWAKLDQIDDLVERQLQYAFSPQWGYLTACPANVGTGLRASLLLHLPGLSMTGQIEKAFRLLQRSGLVVRGISGDQAWGDFYRIGNQVTLGRSESELIALVRDVVPSIVFHERNAREFSLETRRDEIEVQVNRACEALKKSQLQSNEETLYLLSQVRFGVSAKVLNQQQVSEIRAVIELLQLRKRLSSAILVEDYQLASNLRDRIQELEGGQQ